MSMGKATQARTMRMSTVLTDIRTEVIAMAGLGTTGIGGDREMGRCSLVPARPSHGRT